MSDITTSIMMLARLTDYVPHQQPPPPSGEVVEIGPRDVIALENIFAAPADGSEPEIERLRR